MDVVHSYIFLAQKNEISVFRYRDDKWEIVNRDGQESFPFQDTEDLITWWKEEAGYVDEKVDLLFLSDTPNIELDLELVKKTFQFVKKESIWNINSLRDFFRMFDEMGKVDLVVSSDTLRHVKEAQSGSECTFYIIPQQKNAPENKPTSPSPDDGSPTPPTGPEEPGIDNDGTGDFLVSYFQEHVNSYVK